MAQGIIAGGTDYSGQTIWEIKSDIENWMKYSQKIKNEFNQTISELKDNKYWETEVPFDFRSFGEGTIRICDTFYSDFQIVVKSIESDNVTKREIELMKNIYAVAVEYEDLSWRSFRLKDGCWHDYGNPLFIKAERLYADGRDFYVTLKDVSNALCRMEDYVKDERITQINDNSINIGDNNDLRNVRINHEQNVNRESQPKESWLKKWWWTFVVPIAVAVIAGIILYGLKMN